MNLRPITPEDLTAEGNRNYDLGRKHKGEELAPAIDALKQLFTSCALLRLRIQEHSPKLTGFSDWDDNARVMRIVENVLNSL